MVDSGRGMGAHTSYTSKTKGGQPLHYKKVFYRIIISYSFYYNNNGIDRILPKTIMMQGLPTLLGMEGMIVIHGQDIHCCFISPHLSRTAEHGVGELRCICMLLKQEKYHSVGTWI